MADYLEPDAGNIAANIARDIGPESVHGIAAVSIAISLKRIADAICYQETGRNIFDFVQTISENTRGGP